MSFTLRDYTFGRISVDGKIHTKDLIVSTDHIIPKKVGGGNSRDNLQLLHKHCHDAKTYSDQLVIKLHKAKKSGEKTQALVQ